MKILNALLVCVVAWSHIQFNTFQKIESNEMLNLTLAGWVGLVCWLVSLVVFWLVGCF